jgi:hypothetical protein
MKKFLTKLMVLVAVLVAFCVRIYVRLRFNIQLMGILRRERISRKKTLRRIEKALANVEKSSAPGLNIKSGDEILKETDRVGTLIDDLLATMEKSRRLAEANETLRLRVIQWMDEADEEIRLLALIS